MTVELEIFERFDGAKHAFVRICRDGEEVVTAPAEVNGTTYTFQLPSELLTPKEEK